MRSASTATKYSSFCTISSALSYVKSLPVIYWSQVLKRQVGSASLTSPYDGLISKRSNSRESDTNLTFTFKRTICQKLKKSIHFIRGSSDFIRKSIDFIRKSIVFIRKSIDFIRQFINFIKIVALHYILYDHIYF